MPYVLMAVPPHLVEEVGKLIESDAAPNGSAPMVGEPTFINGWSEETLREHYRASSDNMRRFLAYMAENADEWVNTNDAAEAVGVRDWNSIAGMLGAAGRRTSNHYGLTKPPWEFRWTAEDTKRLRMPGDVAAIILDTAAK